MRGFRNFIQEGEGGGPGLTAGKQSGQRFLGFFLVLNLFYS